MHALKTKIASASIPKNLAILSALLLPYLIFSKKITKIKKTPTQNYIIIQYSTIGLL